MALYSGRTTDLKIDPAALRGAHAFLDSVSSSNGTAYSYTPQLPATPGMTAVGLLCRMYLGWPRTNTSLKQGVHRLSAFGVSRTDMYYNYYATLVLHHFGGREWEQWNTLMREQLIETQIRTGPASGSWAVTDPHGASGAQIYQTCLSILTLEVYYRYLPIYRNNK